MVVMLGVGFVPPPVQGAENAVRGRADEARPRSPAPSVTTVTDDIWVPPWQTAQVDPLAQIDLEYLSPSTLETVELCPRKAAFVKLDRIAKISSDAAELGTAMHAQHDRYFRDGTPYDLTTRAGELALATHAMLPDRDMPGLRVEQEIRFQHAGLPGAWLGGKVDLNWEQPSGAYGDDRARCIVLDHKSSGKREYMKLTREALLHHPQAPIYAAMFYAGVGQQRVPKEGSARGVWQDWRVDPSSNLLELRWNYVLTSSKAATPATEKSWHVVTRAEIEDAFARYVIPPARKWLAIIDQANAVRSTGHPFGASEVEAKPGTACFAFGGCPFRSRCNIAPIDGVRAMTDQAANFLSRVGVGGPGQAPAAAWTPPGQAPAVNGAQVPPPVQQAWQPPGQAPAQHAHAPAGPPGYGARINPPENGTSAPPDPAAEAKAAEKAAKAAAKAAAKEAQASAPQGNTYVSGPDFESTAMAGLLAGLAPVMIMQGAQPADVFGVAHALVQTAVQAGYGRTQMVVVK